MIITNAGAPVQLNYTERWQRFRSKQDVLLTFR